MSIRLNLLAEQQAAEEMRRRDPVKHAFWVGGFLVALMLLWSLYLVLEKWNLSQDEARTTTKWRALETNSIRVLAYRTNLINIEAKLNALHQLSTNRFLWGPFLNSLQFCVGEDLELAHLMTKQEFTETAATKPAKTGGRFTPATATEKTMVTLVARHTGIGPEQAIEQFKATLRNDAFLKRCFTNETSLRLAGFPQQQTDPADPGKPYTQFTLEGVFPERSR